MASVVMQMAYQNAINLILGYKGEPPKKNFNKEGGHHVLQ